MKNSPPSVRKLAQRILIRWADAPDHVYAETLISSAASDAKLAPRDRGQLQSIVFGVLRNGNLIDFWLADHLLKRGGLRKLREEVHTALRTGLCELLILDHSPHAVVNETVNLVGKPFRGLTNAILRRADRERDALLSSAESAPLETRFSHPNFLIDRFTEAFGEAATIELLTWNNSPSPVYLRPNLLHPAPGESPSSDHPLGFYIQKGKLDPKFFSEGQGYAQDPSTALAPQLLDPKPGERILDAFAAPGGKTALLAQLSQDKAIITATDTGEHRLEKLRENIANLHINSATVHEHDWSESTDRLGAFDAILLDVPCSNTGVLRRRVDARWRMDEDTFSVMASLQIQLAKNAAAALAPGGRLVYSTCSIDPEENLQVAEALAAATGLKIKETSEALPHRDQIDGAFSALLQS